MKQLLIPRLLAELKSWPNIFADETGPRINLGELVKHLKAKARNIEYEKSFDVRVAVFGLDLTARDIRP
ncbi:MAG: hypothetical protein OXF11_05065 [Deltaproteobacteria bacterium]|nr:hypothetical protein [Deltaproteobacteria bacterium]